MLRSGDWLGRGSLFGEGDSRGEPVECEVTVDRDERGMTLAGNWQYSKAPARAFTVRVAASDAGTYTLALRLDLETLQGTAKLDSPPSLGLVWHETGAVHAAFSLFEIAHGYGFRGFARDGARLWSWEVALSPKHERVGGGNVVSLHRRRT